MKVGDGVTLVARTGQPARRQRRSRRLARPQARLPAARREPRRRGGDGSRRPGRGAHRRAAAASQSLAAHADRGICRALTTSFSSARSHLPPLESRDHEPFPNASSPQFADSIAAKQAAMAALAAPIEAAIRLMVASLARRRQDHGLRQRRLGRRLAALRRRTAQPLREGARAAGRHRADHRHLDADLDRQRLRLRPGLRQAGARAGPRRRRAAGDLDLRQLAQRHGGDAARARARRARRGADRQGRRQDE